MSPQSTPRVTLGCRFPLTITSAKAMTIVDNMDTAPGGLSGCTYGDPWVAGDLSVSTHAYEGGWFGHGGMIGFALRRRLS